MKRMCVCSKLILENEVENLFLILRVVVVEDVTTEQKTAKRGECRRVEQQ